jgi:hypothetical protein
MTGEGLVVFSPLEVCWKDDHARTRQHRPKTARDVVYGVASDLKRRKPSSAALLRLRIVRMSQKNVIDHLASKLS